MKQTTCLAVIGVGIGYAFCGAACGIGIGGELTVDGANGRVTADAGADSTSKDDAADEQSATADASVDASADTALRGGDARGADGSGSDGSDPSDAPSDTYGTADAAPDTAGPADGDAPESAATDTGAPVDAALPDTGVVDAGSDGATTCDFSGTWGSRLIIDVNWAPQGLTGVILAPGSGQIRQWIKTTRVQGGTTPTEVGVVCGVALPDFQGTQIAGAETYGVHFPDSLFDGVDGGLLPTFSVDATVSGSTPGSTYRTAPSAALLGVTLTNPTTDAWPTPVTTAVDTDQDGNPGVTVGAAQGNGYSNFPVDFLKAQRADRLFLVIRQVTQVSATYADCDHLAGTISIPRIPNNATGKYAIDSHIVGCGLAGSLATCDATQTNFADATQPVFTPTGPSNFTSMRMPDGATCASVRQQLP